MSKTETKTLNMAERNSFRKRQCDIQRENYIFNLKMLNSNECVVRVVLITIATAFLVFTQQLYFTRFLLVTSIMFGIVQFFQNIRLFKDGADLTKEKMSIWMLAYPTEDNFAKQVSNAGRLETDTSNSTSRIPILIQAVTVLFALVFIF